MENEELEQLEEEVHTPRPRWQVWLARLALVVFLAFLLMYYINISRGGI
ncbi:MAG: hypothetical protein IJO45_02565 [Oscillospiraceae bacterium]|nr:hypothetical protein [Oscillospiraceae bacterium]